MADEDWFSANAPPQQPEQDWFAQNAPTAVAEKPSGTSLGQKLAIGTAAAIRIGGGLATAPLELLDITPPTAAARAGIGAAIGGVTDVAAQGIEKLAGVRKEFSPAEAGVAAGLMAIPLGEVPRAWKAGATAYRALQGAGLGATATQATSLLEGRGPASLSDTAFGAGIGGAFGAGGHAILSKIGRPTIAEQVFGKPEVAPEAAPLAEEAGIDKPPITEPIPPVATEATTEQATQPGQFTTNVKATADQAARNLEGQFADLNQQAADLQERINAQREASLGKVEPVAPDLPTGAGAPAYITEDHPLAANLEQISGPDTAFNQRQAQQLFDQGHAIYSTLPDGSEAIKVNSTADISKYDPSSLAVLRSPVPEAPVSATAPPSTEISDVSGNKTPVAQTEALGTGKPLDVHALNSQGGSQQVRVAVNEHGVIVGGVGEIAYRKPDSSSLFGQELIGQKLKDVEKQYPGFKKHNYTIEPSEAATWTPEHDALIAQESASVPSAEAATTASTLPKETPIGGIENAVQEPKAGEILQRQSQEVGTTGSERVGVEPSVQGETLTGARERSTPENAATTPEQVAPPPTEPPTVTESAPISDDQHVSTIANRFTEERTKSGELGEIAPGQGYSTKELADAGLKMSPEQINQHVSDLMNGTGDPIEQGKAVRAEEARLSQRSNELSRAASGNPTNVEARLAADNAFKDLTDFHNGPVARAKQIFHGLGMSMQGELPVDLSTFNGLREAFLRDTGKLPSPEVEPQLRAMAEKVSNSVKEDNGAKQNLGQAIEKATARRKLPSYDEVRNNILDRMKTDPCRV